MEGTVGYRVWGLLIRELDDVIGSTYDTVMGSWPSKTIVVLYVIAVGYMILMGRTGERTKEWLWSAFLLSTISALCATYETFNEYFFGPIYDAAYNLASIGATGGTGGLKSTFTSIENSVGLVIEAIDNMEVPGSIWSDAWLFVKACIAGLILGVLAAVNYAVFVALFSIAMFSFMAVTAAGGPCLWLVCFKETRFITWTWVKAVFNYAMWLFFLGLVSGIGGKFLERAAKQLNSYDMAEKGVFTQEYGLCALLCALSIYMLLKASDWAAALTGGTSSNTGIVGAIGGAAGWAVGSVGGAAASGAWGSAPMTAARSAAARAASAGAARAYSALKGLWK